MAKTIQFRCPKCHRLLLKYDIANDEIEYRAIGLFFDSDEKGNTKYLTCNKCYADLEITKQGLVEREVERLSL